MTGLLTRNHATNPWRHGDSRLTDDLKLGIRPGSLPSTSLVTRIWIEVGGPGSNALLDECLEEYLACRHLAAPRFFVSFSFPAVVFSDPGQAVTTAWGSLTLQQTPFFGKNMFSLCVPATCSSISPTRSCQRWGTSCHRSIFFFFPHAFLPR